MHDPEFRQQLDQASQWHNWLPLWVGGTVELRDFDKEDADACIGELRRAVETTFGVVQKNIGALHSTQK